MELKKASWRSISINDYFQLKDIMRDDTMEPSDREIAILSLLTGETEDAIWSMPIDKFKKLQSQTSWLATPELKPLEKLKFKKLDIGGTKCKVETDLTKFTVAQYIDFQTLWSQRDDKMTMGRVLAIFIVPEGHSYNEGYDILSLIDDILSGLDIQTAYEVMSFFLMSWRSSINSSLTCYNKQMKKLKKTLSKEKWEELSQQLEASVKAISDGFLLLAQ